MNSRILIANAARRLTEAGVQEPKLDAALLLEHITGKPQLELRLGLQLDIDVEERLTPLLDARCARQPLQYILGTQPFCGRLFHVDERVLIPRPQTELLAEMATEFLSSRPAPEVLDLCSGSGCIGITLGLNVPDACVTLADLSPDALAVSRLNADALHCPVNALQSDLFSSLDGCAYDLIVSNPPYIPTSVCRELQAEVLKEPMLALDGGADGLDLYRRIANEAMHHLKPGGRLMLELGIDEDEAVCGLLRQGGFIDIHVYPDLNGILRMISAG